MNLIGNNCAAGFYYKFDKQKFNHPFVWCLFTPEDMIKMIEYYDKINFTDIMIQKMDDNLFSRSNLVSRHVKDHRNIVGINIDNMITPYYVHYLYDERCKTPIIHGIDVFYKRNFEYVYYKYNDRLKRNGILEKPVFLILAYSYHNWNLEYIQKLYTINTDKKIIIITNEEVHTKNNVYVIKDSLRNLDTESLTKSHYKEIKGIIENV